MAQARPSSWVFLVIAFVSNGDALFKDDAGVIDWRKQFIGKVHEAEFDSRSKTMYVATEAGAVAAVNSQQSTMIWRHLLPEPNVADKLIVTADMAITISGKGTRVHAWRRSGELEWETAIGEAPIVAPTSSQLPSVKKRDTADAYGNAIDAFVTTGSSPALVVLANNRVARLDVASGEELWTADLDTEEPVSEANDSSVVNLFRLVVPGSDGNTAVAVSASTGDRALSLSAVQLKSGGVADDITTVDLGSHVLVECRVVSTGHVVCVTDQGLLTVDVSSRAVHTVDVAGITGFNRAMRRTSAAVVVNMQATSTASTAAYAVTTDGTINLLKTNLPSTSSAFGTTTFESHDVLVHVASLADDAVEVAFVDVATGAAFGPSGPTTKMSGFPHATHGAFDVVCAALLYKRASDSKLGYKLVASMQDHALVALRDGLVSWQRDEGLASVVDAVFVDLPVSTFDTDDDGEPVHAHHTVTAGSVMLAPVAFVRRVARQMHDLALLLSGSDHTVHVTAEERDIFNLNKLSVVVTATGKLHGIFTNGGHIAWDTFPAEMRHETPRHLQLFYVKSTVHTHAIVVVVAQFSDGWRLFEIEPLSGVVVSVEALDYAVQLVIPTHVYTADGTSVLLFLDGAARLHTYPRGPAAATALSADTEQTLFAHTIDAEKGVVTGYQLVPSTLTATVVSKVMFDPAAERIAALAFKHREEKVSSLGEILGDRSVIHKYLNPHIIALATTTPYQRGSTTLAVYLLDTVKGHILKKVTHEGVYGAVHLAQAENWVMYHYRNRRAKRFEVGMLEMFDGSDRVPSEPFTALHTPTPAVLLQAYIAPFAVSAVAVTQTTRGMTEKQVLVGLPNGQILGINKRFMDVRRPTNEKAAKHAEGLMKYHPVLQLPPQMVINYNQLVESLRRIFVTPSGLESTCIVLAAGLDLYVTQTAPSQKFDVLNADFPHAMVLISLFGLSGVVIVLQQRSKDKALKMLWT